MRGVTTTIALSLALMAAPAWAQEGHDGHDGPGAGHGEMHPGAMHGGMAGSLVAHAEPLGLSAEQLESLESLDERLAAEKERHHAEMKAIHEAAMEILSPEQRERMHAMMQEMHGADGHDGRMKKNDDAGDSEDHGDHPES
jgi:hypothetical protein